MNPFIFPWGMMPWIPNNCQKPPTMYTILQSIVNYGKDEQQKIKDLAKYGRSTIFDFTYPLSQYVNKEDFECLILNHYLMRRINYDTVTAFRIQLNVKLNEIMPKYNKLFDSLENWSIFSDGERYTRQENESGTNSQTINTSNTATSNASNVSDRRNSELPQDELENLQNGTYVSDYNYDTNTSSLRDNSVSNSSNSGSNTNTRNITETRSPSDKIAIYKQMQNDVDSIYTMIFKDLDCLFYGLE